MRQVCGCGRAQLVNCVHPVYCIPESKDLVYKAVVDRMRLVDEEFQEDFDKDPVQLSRDMDLM